jgi:hypothetical protein
MLNPLGRVVFVRFSGGTCKGRMANPRMYLNSSSVAVTEEKSKNSLVDFDVPGVNVDGPKR